jgi:hypothetical protein
MFLAAVVANNLILDPVHVANRKSMAAASKTQADADWQALCKDAGLDAFVRFNLTAQPNH